MKRIVSMAVMLAVGIAASLVLSASIIASSGSAKGIDRAGICRVLDHNDSRGVRDPGGYKADRLLRAGRNQDLIVDRTKAVSRQVVGDGRSQGREAERVIAVVFDQLR